MEKKLEKIEIDDIQYPSTELEREENQRERKISKKIKEKRRKQASSNVDRPRRRIENILKNNSRPIEENLQLAYEKSGSIDDKLIIIQYAVSNFWELASFIGSQSSPLEAQPQTNLDLWNERFLCLFKEVSQDAEKIHIAGQMQIFWGGLLSIKRKPFQNAKVYLFGKRELDLWTKRHEDLLAQPAEKKGIQLFSQPTLLPQTLDIAYARANTPTEKAQVIIRAIQYFYQENNNSIKDASFRFIQTSSNPKAELMRWIKRFDILYTDNNNSNIQLELITAAKSCWHDLEKEKIIPKSVANSSAFPQDDVNKNNKSVTPSSRRNLIVHELNKWEQRRLRMSPDPLNNSSSCCCIIL